MTATIMNGKMISCSIRESLKDRIKEFESIHKMKIGLATIIVGDDGASIAYIKSKERICADAGLKTYNYYLSGDTKENELIDLINKLNAEEDVHGILVQVPLPKNINQEKIASCISPEKDVDCFNPLNSGKLFRGERCIFPCTPKGIIRLIHEYGINVQGKKAVIVGRSNIIGKPLAMMLLNLNASVEICHSRTQNLSEETLNADILVSATGKTGLIKKDMVKNGAVVIDAGTTIKDGKITGDVDFEAVKDIASYITPVPNGVGSMTTTMLVENVLEAAESNE